MNSTSARGFEELNPTKYNKSTIEAIGAEIAQIIHYKPNKDIKEIVKELGGKIIYQDLEEWLNPQAESIKVNSTRDFEIYLSIFSGPLRERFTIAHELGHYFLHSDTGKKQIQVCRAVSNTSKGKLIEMEANWFAAGFLMPEKDFKKEHEKNSSIYYLAACFSVSPTAAAIRCKSLNLNAASKKS